jgi:drug/metabolite transporter (DMT)-like permease
MKTNIKADLMLILVTMFWGSTYILIKIGLEDIQELNLIALRFVIAFILSSIVFYKRLIKVDFKTIKYALILGLILFSVMVTTTFGVRYTTASNAGFLIGLTVVLIPILSWGILKQKPEKKVVIGVFMALVGIALLSLDSSLNINIGDLLCILCAILCALHIITTGILTKSVDSIALGVLQLGFVGIFSIIFSSTFEAMRLPGTTSSWVVVLFLSVFCTAAGFIVQTTAQQYTSATHAGLIFALEPVFSAIFAYAFAGEVLKVRGYIGAFVLLTSIMIVELDMRKIYDSVISKYKPVKSEF